MDKKDQFEDLINKVMANPELQKKCADALNTGKADELLKEMGYAFTMDELVAYIEDKNEDLSAEELDAVAGGRSEKDRKGFESLTKCFGIGITVKWCEA